MTRQAVDEIITRTTNEQRFRSLLTERPYDALEGYDLTPEEQAALIAASEPDLTALGVDSDTARRFTEAFKISSAGGG